MDTKTARLQAEREDAEHAAEREEEYQTYDGVPVGEAPTSHMDEASEGYDAEIIYSRPGIEVHSPEGEQKHPTPPADIYASTMPGVESIQPGSVQRTEEPEEDEEYCGYLLFAGTRIDQPEYCDEPKATCEAHRGWEDQEI